MRNTHVAIYRQSVQVGPEDWDMVSSAMPVTLETTIADIRAWLDGMGVKPDFGLSHVVFAALEQER